MNRYDLRGGVTVGEWRMLLIGFATGVFSAAVVPMLPQAHAQTTDERTYHNRQSAGDDGDPGRGCPEYESDCTGTAEEIEMPHAYCYVINGQPSGCVPRFGGLWLEKGVQK